MDLLDLLGLCGITLILARGTIFRAVRRLAPKFLGCPQCVGFHVGFWGGGAGLAFARVIATPLALMWLVAHAAILGGAVSLLSSIADGILEHFFGPAVEDEPISHSVFDPKPAPLRNPPPLRRRDAS
jgi:hypothetical protein